MMLTGKKLLILGGTAASYDLVKMAKSMGIYTIVTDNSEQPGVAKQIADEIAMVSTADIDGLIALAKEKKVDGVFCGPSEFNLRNVIRVCEKAGYPCYTDMETWDKCANKDVFKSFCREYGVDTPEQYDINLETPMEELEKIDYPIIVKPTDGSSSAGISVCRCAQDVRGALEKAYAASPSKVIVAEKFIENGGEGFSVSYFLQDGEAYMFRTTDTRILDPVERKSLICQYSCMPSQNTDYYLREMDEPTRKMFKGMGLNNGMVAIQALPYKGKIYFHEMSYRLGGGLTFKITDPLAHFNDMKHMIRYAVGGPRLTEEEIRAVDPFCGGRRGCQLMIPLNAGTIGKIDGLALVDSDETVQNILQYYYEGDTVTEKNIGTLAQNFCRITFFTSSLEETKEKIQYFQKVLKIYDTEGRLMNSQPLDIARL